MWNVVYQAFKIFLSGEWRMAFDKIYLSLVGAAATSEAANQSRARAVQAKAGSSIHYAPLLPLVQC